MGSAEIKAAPQETDLYLRRHHGHQAERKAHPKIWVEEDFQIQPGGERYGLSIARLLVEDDGTVVLVARTTANPLGSRVFRKEKSRRLSQTSVIGSR